MKIKENKKSIIGLTIPIKIGNKTLKARVDTGAYRSSIDKKTADKLNIGPAFKKVRVKSSNGVELRSVVNIQVEICNRKFNATFTLADRKEMKFEALIGRNILKKGFLIDPTLK